MPNIKSAVKRVHQTEVKNARNRAARSEIASEIKKVVAAVEAHDVEAAKAALKVAFSVIDGHAAAGVIHANTAARKKAHAAKLVSDLEAGKFDVATEPAPEMPAPVEPEPVVAEPEPAPAEKPKRRSRAKKTETPAEE